MKKAIMIMGLLAMSLTGGMEAVAQKAEIKASDLYVGAGYTVGTNRVLPLCAVWASVAGTCTLPAAYVTRPANW